MLSKGEKASVSIFDRSGLVPLSDLQTLEWKENFDILRTWHDEFTRQGAKFRSADYIWPTEPLYCWSRVWEYPFAYFQLKRFTSVFSGTPKIGDVGSGVTFFPFAIADLGTEVVCTDIDRTCELDLARASGIISHRGSVSFRLGKENSLPFADSELDAVYCISVLEHIPNFDQTIAEVFRCLKPGGLFVLTFDVAVKGIEGISGKRREDLLDELSRRFSCVTQPREVPLSDALLSDRGPYPMKSRDTAWFRFKQLVKPLIGRTPISASLLAVQSAVLVKDSSSETTNV